VNSIWRYAVSAGRRLDRLGLRVVLGRTGTFTNEGPALEHLPVETIEDEQDGLGFRDLGVWGKMFGIRGRVLRVVKQTVHDVLNQEPSSAPVKSKWAIPESASDFNTVTLYLAPRRLQAASGAHVSAAGSS
jgi:hypothetical protein